MCDPQHYVNAAPYDVNICIQHANEYKRISIIYEYLQWRKVPSTYVKGMGNKAWANCFAKI